MTIQVRLPAISSLVIKENGPTGSILKFSAALHLFNPANGWYERTAGTFGLSYLSWNAEMGFHNSPVFLCFPRKLSRIVAPQIACHVFIQVANLPAVVLGAPKDVGVRAYQILLAAYLLFEKYPLVALLLAKVIRPAIP